MVCWLYLILLSVAISDNTRDIFDCAMRQFGVEWASTIIPHLDRDRLQLVVDALNGSPEKPKDCNVTIPHTLQLVESNHRFGIFPIPVYGQNLYVDAINGNDGNSGTLSFPLRTIKWAVSISRKSTQPTTIILRKGTFYLNQTIFLTAQDSGLVFQSYPKEEVWVSGATPLKKISWRRVNKSTNIWSTDLSSLGISSVLGLRLNGRRMIRARYPNADPELGFGSRLHATSWHAESGKPNITFNPKIPLRNRTHRWSTYKLGIDGVCNIFDPPCGYWCSGSFSWTSGMNVTNKVLPNQGKTGYSDPEGAVIQTWRGGHWCSWMYEIGKNYQFIDVSNNRKLITDTSNNQNISCNYEYETDFPGNDITSTKVKTAEECCQACIDNKECKAWTLWVGGSTCYLKKSDAGRKHFTDHISGRPGDVPPPPPTPAPQPTPAPPPIIMGVFPFSKGGSQCARGEGGHDEFYIENVMEELDAPAEWFFNKKNKMLFYWHNETNGTPPPIDGSLAIVNLKQLINVTATQSTPASSIAFKGIGFRDAAYTYLDPHGIPSGGDWALQRHAALFFEGTHNLSIDGCIFERLDGNAIAISGYARYATVSNSEFVWIGDSAIISWGDTTGSEPPIPGVGPDGSDGNQPRYNQIFNNFVHELGIWQKQSSFYFQAKTAFSNIHNNIFFNGPRAGINFNDGFIGGNKLTRNFVFNTCRESGDHGPFNNWDRQVFTSEYGAQKQWDEVSYNFFLANYNSQDAVDNDDGSSWFHTHNNFLIYSECGLKSDYESHHNYHSKNVYAWPKNAYRITQANKDPDNADHFFNNTVILPNDAGYASGDSPCPLSPGAPLSWQNQIYTPTGKVTICSKPLSYWQDHGVCNNTFTHPYPQPLLIIDWAKKVLRTNTD